MPSQYVVVTDTDVHWVPGSAGPSQITILSPHTITFGGDSVATPSPSLNGDTPCLTIIGSDGKPTIIESASTIPDGQIGGIGSIPQSNSILFSTSGVAGQVSDILSLPIEAGTTTCTSYNIIGPDGLPTVVHSTWVVTPTALPTNHIEGLPTTSRSLPSASQILPNSGERTLSASYTVVGADGSPTVIESTWIVAGPANTQSAVAGLSSVAPSAPLTSLPAQITAPPIPSSTFGSEIAGIPIQESITTCTSYTVFGADGRPSVIDTTWVIASPAATLPLLSNAIPANIMTGVQGQVDSLPGSLSQSVMATGMNGITTCTTYTVIGVNGLPTVVESTPVLSASNALPTASRLALPSASPQHSVINLPQGSPPSTRGNDAVTTCITVGILGPDGVATPVVETIVFTPVASGDALPIHTTIGLPPIPSQQVQGDLPQGVPPFTSGIAPFTTCITLNVMGPNGMATPIIQTVVLTPSGTAIGHPSAPQLSVAGVPELPPSVSVVGSNVLNTFGIPSLDAYGSAAPGLHTLLPPSGAVSGVIVGPVTVTGTMTSVLTVTALPEGASDISLPAYGSPLNTNLPNMSSVQLSQKAYGSSINNAAEWLSSAIYGPVVQTPAVNSLYTTTTLQTSTWTNVIPEQTTTYTVNFPLTTMATVTLPAGNPLRKRALRRQQR